MANAERVGAMLADRIAARTPRSSGAGHMPGGGHAADSATHIVSKIAEGVRISVGFPEDAFYMGFREQGTSHQAAQPVVRPTVLESKNDIIAGIAGS